MLLIPTKDGGEIIAPKIQVNCLHITLFCNEITLSSDVYECRPVESTMRCTICPYQSTVTNP